VVVPNVVMYLGATPVYADIDPATYNAEAAELERRVTPRTKVILAQNTFGLTPDLDPILELAGERGLRVVEDCAHGFGGSYRDRPNGTTADVAFFSSQWSKPFSTGLGGFTITRDPALAADVRAIERTLDRPTPAARSMLRALLFARKRLLRRTGYWAAIRLYRYLSSHNLVIGSSSSGEVDEPVMPVGFLRGLSDVQAREGLAQLDRIQAAVEHRRRIAGRYRDALGQLGAAVPEEPDYARHAYLRFPLLTHDRRRFMDLAVDEGIEIGDWFVSPLHPVEGALEAWGYRWGENPVAEEICRGIVNLPTHGEVDDRGADRIIDFVRRNRDLLADRVALPRGSEA
jgi:dTDP-4-amino-4,6-dideoxygalactose transaminase